HPQVLAARYGDRTRRKSSLSDLHVDADVEDPILFYGDKGERSADGRTGERSKKRGKKIQLVFLSPYLAVKRADGLWRRERR
ncbi:hypothetical protein BaRGS_00007327, partial [Batillaria attramentaria]